jgi:hypothetical protein
MMTIDYKHWFKINRWTLEQAAYLFSGIDPNDQRTIEFLDSRHSLQRTHSPGGQWGPSLSKQRLTRNLQLLEGYEFSDDKDGGSVPVAKLLSNAKKIGFEDKRSRQLLREWAVSQNNPSRGPKASTIQEEVTTNEGHFGQVTIDAFDPLGLSGIVSLFSTVTPKYTDERWKSLASRAKVNGLIEAREAVAGGRAESTFNPVRVANWLIAKHGSPSDHITRKLKNNMPDRSKDRVEEVFGID